MSNADIYRKAADLLRNGHWIRGHWSKGHKKGNDNDMGSYCLIGAVNVARGAKPSAKLPNEIRADLATIITTKTGQSYWNWNEGSDGVVWGYNDDYRRTAEDVIDVLEKAAEL